MLSCCVKLPDDRYKEGDAMNILVIDIGTTSIRGILFGSDGEMLASHSIYTPVRIEQNGQFVEQDPAVYRHALVNICKTIAADHPVDAISVTAFRSAPTMVDREGNALCNFIMWQDTRNAGICRGLSGENDFIYHHSGAKVNTVFTASKLTWLKRNAPEMYGRAYKAMIVPDYVVNFMTGEFATDHTYGSRTHVMDIHTLEWSDDLCRLFDIEKDKLLELRSQGSVIGRVNASFARFSGIKEGTPVISAGGDQQCGALGLGVLDCSTIEVNSGTGSFVISLVDKPYLENMNVICNVAAIPGKYTQEMNIIASASALNWLIREFFPEHWGEEPDFEKINRLAEETPAGANGLFCVPHFQGCGSRDWNPESRAQFYGFSLGTRRNDMVRALYEGIAAEISKSIDALPEVCRRAESIAVAGGLSKSGVYNQILSDVTGRSLIREQNAQATAYGAYISASVALGVYGDYAEALKQRKNAGVRIYTPNRENTRFYKTYKERTERLYRNR